MLYSLFWNVLGYLLLIIIVWMFSFYNITMSCFDVLKSQAQALGLQGSDVGQYVLQQQALQRAERAQGRAERQIVEEREEKEKEKAKKEKKREEK